MQREFARYYHPHVPEGFDIRRLNRTLVTEYDAASINDVLISSWTAKFVPHVLKLDQVEAKILSATAQQERIKQPYRDANYWVTQTNRLGELGVVNAMLRVETYVPTLAKIRRNKPPYPNVSDLETANGSLRGRYENHAAALLYFALNDYDPKVKVAAYTEEQYPEGVDFYRELGFRQKRLVNDKAGNAEIVTVHMEAENVNSVVSELERLYPAIAH